ncbi:MULTISPECIES: HhoA/HhoB/HtrA family serine endopeptidase [unclassified Moorena]|uniref:HhoA/HhoB/HtrA family serine endopeptidase n=1 Tax=unclassified Moorena TaxID=2683338 RepID=UPI0013BAC7A1|nr:MULTISPECIES: HhoA/HhoB/HtrA family serine endopeptidase [unclassified Moorena]NEP31166.1 trypsin-like serine protease [Moorena sp. SIO3B2]NEP64804.1 trypsin-like serine protease [Moorena sp. SIO3A5]NEQ05030.1 trypsin-like serine protease [Moorena sp. SIO4E2]NER85749.1 trypsin-like serine protease [Moorena sp. SIO3A2]NES41240.1 trypsin-like serine protease [Moorena sp. SIO2C4]
MSSTKFSIWLRSISNYLLAILLGVLLTVGVYRVSPSKAAPVPSTDSVTPPLIAQQLLSPQQASNSSFVTAAVNRVGAAVVRIDTERTVSRRVDPLFDDPFFRRFFGDDFSAQIPQERRLQGQGSGFIIDNSGILLTNAHVVEGADKVTVTLKDGRKFNGQVKGVDEFTDLAVVKINGTSLPIVSLGDSSQVQVGDWAIAVGNPLGLDNTVTLGIVSTIGRSSAQAGIPDKRLDFIQTDAAINPGNSGGPLLNATGEVIGINTAIRANAMGIGFAIPINKVKEISNKLAQGQKVVHPYIGVRMTTLTPELAQENNNDPNSVLLLPEINGVLVIQVMPDTPAADAGMRRGDIIVQIDGTSVTNATQLQRLVENSGVNKVLEIKVRRGKQTTSVFVRTDALKNPN